MWRLDSQEGVFLLPEKENKALTRSDLKKLARLRLKEAEHLYRKGFFDGCLYLCGYVVEFALKARVCKVLRLTEYPVEQYFRTHDRDRLRLLAGLQSEISVAKNSELFVNWSKVTEWDPELRYSPAGTCDNIKAGEMLDCIKSKPNGVLTWLTKRW